MTRLQREVLKSIVPLAILTVIVAVASKAIGGWVQVIGPPAIVIGAGMVWGGSAEGEAEARVRRGRTA